MSLHAARYHDRARAILTSRRRIREQIERMRQVRGDGGDTALACLVLRFMLRSLSEMRAQEKVANTLPGWSSAKER